MNGVYDLRLVALSVAIAFLISYTALDLTKRMRTAQGQSWLNWLIAGAVAMGAAIWAMHFIGMLAFTLPIPQSYDLGYTLLSLGIAILTSGCALWLLRCYTRITLALTLAASFIGIGIAIMHYVEMAAMKMLPAIEYDPVLVAASVGLGITLLLGALHLSVALQKRNFTHVIAGRLVGALLMGIGISGAHYLGMAAAQFSPNSICLAAASGGGGVNNFELSVMVGAVVMTIMMVTLIVSALDAYFSDENTRTTTSLQSAVARLQELALHDQLTGLANRLLFEDRLRQAAARTVRSGRILAGLVIDLDKFKLVNDLYGHHVGDELLKEVARRLRNCIRDEDTAARIGGDEFAMVLTELTGEEDAALVAKKITAAFSHPFLFEGCEIHSSCSIGIGVYRKNEPDLTNLMRRADIAMYYSKQGGHNRYAFYTAEMDAAVSAHQFA